MANLGTKFLTMADIVKMTDPDGTIADIVDVLHEENPALNDMPWVMGNLITGHRYSEQLTLAAPSYRMLNQGVDPTISKTQQRDEVCCLLEGRGETDLEMLRLGGNESEIRWRQDRARIEGFAQEIEGGIFYNSVVSSPEKFHGIMARYDDPSARQGGQIIEGDSSAAGATQMSILAIGWHPAKVFGIYPMGTQMGLESRDLGEIDAEDRDGKKFRAMGTQMIWRPGLAVADYRNIVRIANIDTDNLVKNGATGADIPDLMTKMVVKMRKRPGRWMIYMTELCFEWFTRQMLNGQTQEPIKEFKVGGEFFPHFRGFPIRITDGLINTEAAVTGF